jgi:hypothetical protein
MARPVINPGTLHWCGEHWINYLRLAGAEVNSGMVSLYHTRYSAAGEGTAVFVDITDQPECLGLYTDNREVATFIQEMIRGRGNPFDREPPIIDAHISRTGDIRFSPSWVIDSGRCQIIATWADIQPPVIAEGPAPTFGSDRDFFTLLFFADRATITCNGLPVKGQPYQRDIWQASIGGNRSSCVFALAETMIMVRN